MRISDWSSDVCSSDLLQGFEEGLDGRIVVAISLAAHRWTQAIGLQLFFDSRKSNIGCRDHPAPRPARSGRRRAKTGAWRCAPAASKTVDLLTSSSMIATSGACAAKKARTDCAQIGRASCRERGCQYGEISGGDVTEKT